jgi:hypothetical protein
MIIIEDRTLMVQVIKNDVEYRLSYNKENINKYFILEQRDGDNIIGYINIDNSIIVDLCSLFLERKLESEKFI